jgi:hypothetical protein
MNVTAYDDWLYDTSFMAGMNQDYYQTMILIWSSVDSVVTIAVAGLALASVVFGLLEGKRSSSDDDKPTRKKKQKATKRNPISQLFVNSGQVIKKLILISDEITPSTRFSIWSAVAAVSLIVIPTSSIFGGYKALYAQWTDLRSDVDALVIRFDEDTGSDEVSPTSMAFVDAINRRVSQIESDEPAPWDWLVNRAYDREKDRRSREPWPAEQTANAIQHETVQR